MGIKFKNIPIVIKEYFLSFKERNNYRTIIINGNKFQYNPELVEITGEVLMALYNHPSDKNVKCWYFYEDSSVGLLIIE